MRCLLILLLLVPLAGCLEEGSVEPLDVAPPAVLELPAPAELGAPVRVRGDCPGLCRLAVEVPDLPEGGLYEVLVSWDGSKTTGNASLPGAVRGFDSLRWLLDEPGPVQVDLRAAGAVDVRLRVLGPDLPFVAGDRMLPNIVTYAPVQVAFDSCDAVEREEQGATRCLRLGNAIGNTGDGPLQVELTPAEGALTPAGMGSFDQIVLLQGGGHDRHNVGNADFHLSHMHFHYDGFARFSLYEWDEETGLRGELAAEHHKSGFCFLDWGEMQEPDRRPQDTNHAEDDCLIPSEKGWTMGVTAGWFDFYWSRLTDQYVDVAGVPDGTYELVSVADWNDSLVETDESDNAASAVIRIEGDAVEVLETRSFYHLPDDTRNL